MKIEDMSQTSAMITKLIKPLYISSILFVCFISFPCYDVNAQIPRTSFLKGWHVAPSYFHGSIFKHTPKFRPEIPHASNAFELNFAKQMNGRREWQQVQRYPFLGVAAGYTHFGNNEVIGHGFSLMPNIELLLLSTQRFSFHFRTGSGLAFLSKHYDYVQNPTNNLVGSSINNISFFSFSGNWLATDKLSFFAGGSFTHFSTGSVQTPNLGINIPAWNIGIKYTPVPYSPTDFIKKELSVPTKKVLFALFAGRGFQEGGVPNGPLYGVYTTEFMVGKMLTRWNKCFAGVMGTYKEAAYTFIRLQEIYTSNYFLNSCAASVYAKDEFLFGFIGVSVAAGYYVYRPSPLEHRFYQKLGMPVYFPPIGKIKNDVFSLGVYLTAGGFTADFVSVDAGFQF